MSSDPGSAAWRQYKEDLISWDAPQFTSGNEPAEELSFVSGVYMDQAGRIWLSSDGNGLFMFDGQAWHQWWWGDNSEGSDGVRGVATLDNRICLILSNSGEGQLYCYDVANQRWENPWQDQPSLQGNAQANQIASGADNTLYVASASGPQNLYGKNGTVYTGPGPWQLNIYRDGKWQQENMPCPGHIFQPLYVDLAGTLWVSSPKAILCSWSNEGWKKYDLEKSGKVGEEIRTIEMDSFGRLWVAVGSDLVVRDTDGSWLLIPARELPFSYEETNDIAVDGQGRLWFLAKDLLSAYNGRSWQYYPRADTGLDFWGGGLYGPSLAFDREDHLWLVTGQAVLKLQTPTELAPADGNIELFQKVERIEVPETIP